MSAVSNAHFWQSARPEDLPRLPPACGFSPRPRAFLFLRRENLPFFKLQNKMGGETGAKAESESLVYSVATQNAYWTGFAFMTAGGFAKGTT
jgi:hypothetical protein